MLQQDQIDRQRKILDPKKLMGEAEAKAGLSDYGDRFFTGPMNRLLDRAASEVDFTAKGIEVYANDIVRFLVNRLRMQNDIRRHPEILDEDVSDPVIIIGLPHSGTTKVQRMMADAPQVQKLLMWRMLNPAPFPEAVAGEPDPRMGGDAKQYWVGDVADKNDHVAMAQAAHAVSLNTVDEEFVMIEICLDEAVAGFATHIPLFNYWLWEAGKDREDDLVAYRLVRTLLQYLQWQDGGKRNRPWIMKAIFHIAHMDALLECFPKATLLHCHRDPRNAIPGIAKGMWAGWSTKANVDKKFVGQEFLKWGETAVTRYLEARQRLRLDDRILDINYDNIRTNIMPDIREAYRRAGWEMTVEAETAMLQWEQTNEQGKHGKNVYSLEEFGLSNELIDRTFAEYIHRFIGR